MHDRLIEQLVRHGVPVCRASFGLMTKHPELVWRALAPRAVSVTPRSLPYASVISAAVNEACRLESLCKPLATTMIMSEAFVQAAAPAHARDLGLHTLKGVSAQVRAFTLDAAVAHET